MTSQLIGLQLVNSSLLNVRCYYKAFISYAINLEIVNSKDYLIFICGTGAVGTWMGTLNRYNSAWRINLLYRNTSFSPSVNSGATPNLLNFPIDAWSHVLVFEVS